MDRGSNSQLTAFYSRRNDTHRLPKDKILPGQRMYFFLLNLDNLLILVPGLTTKVKWLIIKYSLQACPTLPFEWLNMDTPPMTFSLSSPSPPCALLSSSPPFQNPHWRHIFFIAVTNSGLVHGRRCRWWKSAWDVWGDRGIRRGWVGSDWMRCLMRRWDWSWQGHQLTDATKQIIMTHQPKT